MHHMILEKLYNIDHIPSHPAIKEIICAVLDDIDDINEKNINLLATYISFDPTLTLEFLKIANAGSYGFKGKISSIHNALLVIENDLIRLIIRQHPVIPNLRQYPPAFYKEYLTLIRHSIEVHIIVENLLEGALINTITDLNFKNELIASSTLHDIGLFFLLIYFPDLYNLALGYIPQQTMPDSIVPEHIPVSDHSFLGAVISEYWNLPRSVRTAVAFHHYPWAGNKQFRLGAEVLYLADSLSSSFYDLYHAENDQFSIEEHIIMKKQLLTILERFGIEITGLAMLRQESLIHTEKILSNFSFTGSSMT